jgi:hypothetical protein
MVAIQEHRLQTKQEVDLKEEIHGDGSVWTLDFCSATPQGTGGVGLLTSSRLQKVITNKTKISDRILRVDFAGNPATTVVVVYAPTNDKSTEITDQFYNDLIKCKIEVPPHKMLIIAGDFNARIGTDSATANPKIVGKHMYQEESNKNGLKLVEFCETADLRPTQTRFPHPKSRLWTWQCPKWSNKTEEHRYQIDHILINGKWLNSVKNVRAYNSVEIGSDHRIVSAKIKISFRATEQNKIKRHKFNWSKLQQDPGIQSQFNIEVKNRFESLRNESDALQVKFDNFEKAVEETATEILGKLKRKPKRPWVSTGTMELLSKRNQAKRDFKRTRKEEDRQRLQQLDKQLEHAYGSDEVGFLNGKLHQLNEAAISHRLRTTWKIVNEISGKSKTTK